MRLSICFCVASFSPIILQNRSSLEEGDSVRSFIPNINRVNPPGYECQAYPDVRKSWNSPGLTVPIVLHCFIHSRKWEETLIGLLLLAMSLVSLLSFGIPLILKEGADNALKSSLSDFDRFWKALSASRILRLRIISSLLCPLISIPSLLLLR